MRHGADRHRRPNFRVAKFYFRSCQILVREEVVSRLRALTPVERLFTRHQSQPASRVELEIDFDVTALLDSDSKNERNEQPVITVLDRSRSRQVAQECFSVNKQSSRDREQTNELERERERERAKNSAALT